MMDTQYTDYIDHPAVVEEVDGSRGVIRVRVDDGGDCACCPAARLCGVPSSSAKDGGKGSGPIDVPVCNPSAYHRGDRVTVRGTERMHRRAIMLATVFPSLALVAVMTAIYLLTGNQLAAALGGIGVTIIFFLLLYAGRNRIAHEFTFHVVEPPRRR